MDRRPMSELEPKPASLLGQRVAFTGRFATLSKPQAARVVRTAGGHASSSVTARTTMLVVGMRGWPLMETGAVTHNLREAQRRRGCRIVAEAEFREIVGLESGAAPTSKALPLAQVCATLELDEATVRRWELLGLVRSHEGRYDFQDLVSLRTIATLSAKGVVPSEIRESLRSIASHLPGIDRPLAQLSILLSDSGRLVAEVEDALLGPHGQLEMHFSRQRPAESIHPIVGRAPGAAMATGERALEHLRLGIEFEERGELREAEREFRQAVADAPQEPAAQFNLGNVLLAQGKYAGAAERFGQCVELDASHGAAWFNLAHARERLNELPEALRCLERAVQADPTYADAQFNLADVAERLGKHDVARRAWGAYLRLDPSGAWASEARRRMQQLRGPAWA